MQVTKRDGSVEDVKFDKIAARIKKQVYGLSDMVNYSEVAQKVIQGIYDGVSTRELDQLASQKSASLVSVHPDYSKLAARISITALHKETKKLFSQVIKELYEYVDPKTGEAAPLISKEMYSVVKKNSARLNGAIIHDRDFLLDYFGFRTMERAYLLKTHGRPAERPQHLFMRVAVGIHMEDIDKAIETYDLLSQKYFTHATPTLFNAGTPKPQMSSCFLLTMKDDSISGIYDTLKQCALISQSAGGIGLSIHNIRATGSYIKGTNGVSNGIVPMLRNFNDTARYVDQGGGKRKGSFAIYLEPWHADVRDFLDLRKNTGKEERRARDLFYAMWIPDLFMKRVQEGGKWTLMCPNECPGLSDCYGDEFEQLYTKYEKEGRGRESIPAQELWFKILESQIETGTPYMLYKDAANKKSNQKHLGTIKSSNLCTEIMEYTSPDEVAVCNLASLALPMYLKQTNSATKTQNKKFEFDFKKLYEVTKVVTRNLNKVIDLNYYPVEEAKNSNMRHRPIGIGVQGLADVFAKMGYAFDSDAARDLNRDIFEMIYFASMEASMEIAKELGPYKTFDGSDISKGIFQFDYWESSELSPRLNLNWNDLKEKVKQHGARNSLLLAPMPTASTAQILGNNECFEPYTSNIYERKVLSGNFVLVNPHLVELLVDMGIWNEDVKNKIIANRGSVQGVSEIPQHVQEVYKTVWEISQKRVLQMAADRGAFICQSQSMNVFMDDPTFKKLTSMHFYGWQAGLKTGMYYLRTKPAADAIQFTVDKKYKDEKPSVTEVNYDDLPDRPEDSQFECFGCGA